MHPSYELRGTKNRKLEGRKIVLGVTGSIAAVECVKLIRELIRHGALVYPVMTAAAARIIHPDSLWFASGNPVIEHITGAVEHVALCGKVKDRADLLMIAPATSNTISKMACGIDDTPVTTFAATAIGTGIPVMVAPAMHESMYDHPAVQENIVKLKGMGVEFIAPIREENKAKLASIDLIVMAVLRKLGPSDLKGNRVLVIAGSTREPIDDIRCITNSSSGKTGIGIALAAWYRGAAVELWYGTSPASPPDVFPVRSFDTVGSLMRMSRGLKLGFDAIIVPAAISDYSVEKAKGKLESENVPELKLKRTPKVIKAIRARFKGVLVGFKAQTGQDDGALEREARDMMASSGADLAVANNMSNVLDDTTEIIIVPKKGAVTKFSGTKLEAADAILDEVVKLL